MRLAYDDAGSGKCVVLIHGHPFDRTPWEPQVASLRHDFRLVTMELASSRPERCWAIGLVATTAEPASPGEQVTRRERADAVERDGMQVLMDYMHTGLYGPSCPPAIRTRVDAMMRAASPAGVAAALRGRADRPDYRPALAGLDIPAFVCAGTEDPWSNRAVTDEILAFLKHPRTAGDRRRGPPSQSRSRGRVQRCPAGLPPGAFARLRPTSGIRPPRTDTDVRRAAAETQMEVPGGDLSSGAASAR